MAREVRVSRERWLPVAGFEGLYEVSDRGRVRSLDRHVLVAASTRTGSYRKRVSGGVLSICRTRGGYSSVHLDRKSRRVARLVLRAFRGRAMGREAAHLNGVRSDDRLANLQWKTRRANEQDKRRHGTLLHGSKCPWAKLDEAAVRDIRVRRAAGESFAAIARALGHGYSRVYAAGTSGWSHV